MIYSCLITGIGGQGTAIASRIIGTAATAKGLDAKGAKAELLSRRGGSAISHIRFGQNIHSPLIPQGKADLVIALDPAEAVRTRTFISPTGRMLALDRPVMPSSLKSGEADYPLPDILSFLKAYMNRPSEEHLALKDTVEWLILVDAAKLIEKCGSTLALNTALLGAAAARKLIPLTAGEIIPAIKEIVPPESLDINIRAFNAGLELGKA